MDDKKDLDSTATTATSAHPTGVHSHPRLPICNEDCEYNNQVTTLIPLLAQLKACGPLSRDGTNADGQLNLLVAQYAEPGWTREWRMCRAMAVPRGALQMDHFDCFVDMLYVWGVHACYYTCKDPANIMGPRLQHSTEWQRWQTPNELQRSFTLNHICRNTSGQAPEGAQRINAHIMCVLLYLQRQGCATSRPRAPGTLDIDQRRKNAPPIEVSVKDWLQLTAEQHRLKAVQQLESVDG